MRLLAFLYICVVASSLIGGMHSFGSMISNVSETIHSRIGMVDGYFKIVQEKLKSVFNEVISMAQSKIKPKPKSTPQTLEEFKKSLDKINDEAHKHTKKEKELEEQRQEL